MYSNLPHRPANHASAAPPDREYDLVMRQEPKQARMCGVGGKGASTATMSWTHELTDTEQLTAARSIHRLSSS